MWKDVNLTTHGLEVGRILATLERFDCLFGLKLGHLLLSAAECTSLVLQAKSRMHLHLLMFYKCRRQDEAFDYFFESTVKLA